LIIRDIHEDKSKDTKFKKINDPVTRADIAAQFIIKGAFTRFFKGLQFVGEETQEPKQGEEPKFDVESVNLDYITIECLASTLGKDLTSLNREIETKRCCVYVDPLDGTKDYVRGTLDAVTTMIGITVDDRPFIGIILRPFAKVE